MHRSTGSLCSRVPSDGGGPMDQYSMLGFLVIVVLYATIGLLAATGAISITRKIFGPKAEQVFYGLFLVIIASFYLAFVAYFGNAAAWRAEKGAVGFFALVRLFCVRPATGLVIRYALHRARGPVHEPPGHGV